MTPEWSWSQAWALWEHLKVFCLLHFLLQAPNGKVASEPSTDVKVGFEHLMSSTNPYLTLLTLSVKLTCLLTGSVHGWWAPNPYPRSVWCLLPTTLDSLLARERRGQISACRYLNHTANAKLRRAGRVFTALYQVLFYREHLCEHFGDLHRSPSLTL